METKDQIIELIIKGVSERLISLQDLCGINNTMSTLIYRMINGTRSDYFKLSPETKIPEDKANQIVTNFKTHQKVKQYTSTFNISPKMMEFLISQKKDIDICFIDINGTLRIAYEHSQNIGFYISDIDTIIEINNFSKLKGDFKTSQIKKDFDNLTSKNGLGSPFKVTIPSRDLVDFDNFKTGKKNPYAVLCTAINDETDENKGGRVTLVMRFFNDGTIDGDHNYDTFNPCPPGNC